MIALIDHEVGRILGALETAGMAEKTLVVFTSDHGEMLGNHQQLLKGPQLYDDLTRVPLIFRWPERISEQSISEDLVQWIDLPATLLDAVSCAPGRGVQGKSLLPRLDGKDCAPRPWALTEFRDSGFPTELPLMTTMLRHGDWKLIVWHGHPTSELVRDGELYNLRDDPDELHNLFHSPDHKDRVRGMKRLLLGAMCEAEDRTHPRLRIW